MMNLSFIAKALNLPFSNKDSEISAVTSDSRKIAENSLFVALPGERVDGHDYIEQAVKAGASAIICKEGFNISGLVGQAEFFFVPDTLAAYRKLAHAWRSTFEIPLIVVAGSVGKTTTKEFLASMLRGKWTDVLRTQGSQNGFVGIPMTLLELRSHHSAAVIEVGIDDVGTMIQHMEVIRPTHALLTAIGPEHLERIGTIENVAREEAIALEQTVQNGGTVVINLDDPYIAPLAKKLSDDFWVGYSFKTPASNKIVNANYNNSNGHVKMIGYNLSTSKDYTLNCPLLGSHNASNLVCAFTMARILGLSLDEIRDGLQTFRPAFGRSEIKKFGSTTVLCDYYNANPESVGAALEVLKNFKTQQPNTKLIAVLGDMLELGDFEEKMHRDLAPAILKTGVSSLYLYGKRMKWLQDELKKSAPQLKCQHFETHPALAQELKTELDRSNTQPSTLLIKGSRSMKMETVFELLYGKN